MSSPSKLPSIGEVGDVNLSNCSELHKEHDAEEDDVDEEEDIDFNPFLKDSPSLEASSSLSSDIEVLDDAVTGQLQEITSGDAEFGEETVMQVGKKDTKSIHFSTEKKNKSVLTSSHELETYQKRENCESSGTDSNVARDTAGFMNSFVEDLEDAISKRTRARYSLASFTLDELETFLQETDDEDDLHNVDDEEEYNKFLAAVLQGGDEHSQIRQDNENVEDEDEENDADFELELEEALESDLEENYGGDIQQENAVSRRPETRLNKRQKASDEKKRKILRHPCRPLRPLLPNTPVATFPTLIPKTTPRGLSHPVHNNISNGFTPEQLVQLHCLIHEHVQLLIQVFSLSVLDPSKQQIAFQVKDLISVAVQKREQVISWKRAQYPFFLFPPYTHPSVPHGHTQPSPASCAHDSDRSCSDPKEALSEKNSRPQPHRGNKRDGFFHTLDSALPVPFVNGLILSVLDVAPLALVGKYMDDVSIAIQERQLQLVKTSYAVELAMEPLFPFDNSQTLSEDGVVVGESTKVEPTKKTLAAVLVEKTKKQSIALVPKEIAGLARRFLSLFNPVLYPHKPPAASTVNRILFTDAEDELLALGLMEYNSDWKAIQQHYLPCKSKHQIFVRQKNRASSKAPDNPIKAVRKMKNSPLTEDEISRIVEGLKNFKLDWMAVWKYVVPYRDPSLLPRQWRIANGTQKSYKTSDDVKARRRSYEFNRRNKTAAVAPCQTSPEKEECQTDIAGGENNSGDDCMGKEDEAYVHEAFLADWRPATSYPNSSSLPFSNFMEGCRPFCNLLSQSGPRVIEQARKSVQTNSNIAATVTTSRRARSQLVPRPYRSDRKKKNRVVKLAPDLPPLNLPASVRVMSQSAFKSLDTGKEVLVKSSSEKSKATQHPGEFHVPVANQHLGESHVSRAKRVARGKNQSDLKMHPLLFQASEDPYLPYYPLNSGNSTLSSFNFFPNFPPQLNPNLSILHLANQAANHFGKSSKESTSAVGIDFHPLLHRTDDVTTDLVTGRRFPLPPASSEFFISTSAQFDSAPLVENSFPGNVSESINVNEKANEVDLDIHLSLSRSEFVTESRDVEQPFQEPPSALFQNRIPNNIDSGVHPTALSGDGISLCAINVGDQSLPGIVMEREELSDSEEEIGEHVEFECEEMDDSEGEEGSNSEQIKGLTNSKEAAGAASGKQKISDALSLNLSSFLRNDSKTSSVGITGRPSRLCKKPPSFQNDFSENTQREGEIRPVLDLLALNTAKRPKKTLRRNKKSGSDTGSFRKGDLDSNTKSIHSAGGPSSKVDTNLEANNNVENCKSL